MVLSVLERQAVSRMLTRIGSGPMALLYAELSGQPAAWMMGEPPMVNAVRVIDYVGTDIEACLRTCDWLVQSYPADAQKAVIEAIAERLRQQVINAAPNPVDEIWIGAEPMVNRAGLRGLLRDIINGFNLGVVYVAGGLASGRSHSSKLIRHVARKEGVPHYVIDFNVPIDERTMGRLFGKLREACGLAALVEPVAEGASPGDVAQKFASRLRDALQNADHAGPRRWLVIDFSDDVPDPAVSEFLRLFCANRANADFDNCVIFVLGPLAHLESMRGLLTLEVEELGPVTSTEILLAAQAINARGTKKLSDQDIQARAVTIYGVISQLPELQRYPDLRRLLLDVRREVRAP